MTEREIAVSAGVLIDPAGRAALVRKAGTDTFMQPGGKPEAGEDALTALLREIHEELGFEVPADRPTYLGHFRAEAANEPGHTVAAEAYRIDITDTEVAHLTAGAEIAELIWVDSAGSDSIRLAPLSALLLRDLTPATH